MSRRLNITILHLDLGIGGAERLIVDTALAFKSLGHNVEILTSHHDPKHCFEETLDPSLLGNNVIVIGDWLPRHIFGRFTVFCAVLRMVYIALVLVLGFVNWSSNMKRLRQNSIPDLVFLDGVSAPLVVLYLYSIPTMFYCHYPDMLLATKRGGFLQRFYRNCFDRLEDFTTGHANLILVNSKFTQQRFAECFPAINAYCPATVLYPCLPVDLDTSSQSSSSSISISAKLRTRSVSDDYDGLLAQAAAEMEQRSKAAAAQGSNVAVRRKLKRIGTASHDDTEALTNASAATLQFDDEDAAHNHQHEEQQEILVHSKPKGIFIPDKFVHYMRPSKSRSSSLDMDSQALTSPRTPTASTNPVIAWPFDSFGEWGGAEGYTCSIKGADSVYALSYVAATRADFVFVSLNRFERKKNISLALQAFKLFKQQLVHVTGKINSPRKEDAQIQVVYLRNPHTGLQVNSSSRAPLEGLSPRTNDSGSSPRDEEDSQPSTRTQEGDEATNNTNASSSTPATNSNNNNSDSNSNSNPGSNSPVLKLRKGLKPLNTSSPTTPGGGQGLLSPAPPIAVIDSPKMLQLQLGRNKESPLMRGGGLYASNSSGSSNENLAEVTQQAPPPPPPMPTVVEGQRPRSRSRSGSADYNSGGFVLDVATDEFLSAFNTNLSQSKVLLVIAGGYEKSVRENVEYLESLKREADALGLKHIGPDGIEENYNISPDVDVVFRTSVSNNERKALLKVASGLLYTPDMEHFGIVPLEAMREGTPVIAVNTGGPLETVVHGRSGYLCPQSPAAFATAMSNLLVPVVVQVLNTAAFEAMRKAQLMIDSRSHGGNGNNSGRASSRSPRSPRDRDGEEGKESKRDRAAPAAEQQVSSSSARVQVQTHVPAASAASTTPQMRHRKLLAENTTMSMSSSSADINEGRLNEAVGTSPSSSSSSGPVVMATAQEYDSGNNPPQSTTQSSQSQTTQGGAPHTSPRQQRRRHSRSGSTGSETDLMKRAIRASGVEATVVMTMGRRFSYHCKKHVNENFSMDSMRNHLRTAIFICLGTTRPLSQMDLLDAAMSVPAHKKAIAANTRRLDEYSSLLIIGFGMLFAFGLVVGSVVILLLTGYRL